MARIRFILLSVAVVVVMSAFASASASAHRFVECLKVAAGSKGLYEESKCEKASSGGEWEKFEIVGVEFKGTGGISKLKTELLGAELLLTCDKAEYDGEIEAGGKSTGEVTFKECSLSSKGTQLLNCEVPAINFKLTGLIELEGIEVESKKVSEYALKLLPLTGTKLVEIVIANKGAKSCIQKGKFPIEGTQVCVISNGAAFEVTHEIDCTSSGSHLEFNKKPATFEGSRSIGTASNDSRAVE